MNNHKMSSDPHIPFHRKLTERELERAQHSVPPFSQAIQRAREQTSGDTLVVAWISDIHLHAQRRYPWPLGFYASQVDSSANLQIALAEIAALNPRPDVLVFGGDLADSGCGGEAPADEYHELKRVLDSFLPSPLRTLPLLGNHDHGDKPLSPDWHTGIHPARRPDWPAPAEARHFYYQTRVNGWRFLALDSRQSLPPDDPQHHWLRDCLAEDANAPTIVLTHRPFVSVGNWVDQYRLLDRRSFDLIDKAACVKTVLSGHTHKTAAWSYRGKLHCVFPACAYGIPDPCGWGLLVLGKEEVRAAFVKDLCAETYDGVASRPRRCRGAFRKLAPQPYELSPLFDPCTLPR